MEQITARRLVGVMQLATSTIEGLALSTIVLQVTLELHVPAQTVGVVLATGVGTAMPLATPLGALSDRIGRGGALALYAALGAAAMAGYAIAESAAGFAAAAVAFAVAQSASGAVRQALAVTAAPVEERLVIRATMHTLLNVGIGLGTTIGAILAATGLGIPMRIAYAMGAAVLLVTAAAALMLPRTLRQPRAPRSSRAVSARRFAVWRDRRFVVAIALAAVIQLTMPVLSVILPLWLVGRTHAPAWLPAAALAFNTLLVIAGQRALAAHVATAHATVVAAAVAGGALVVACGLLASTALLRDGALIAVVLAAIAALTVGEMCGGVVMWRVALDRVPADAEGRYQAAYAMSTGAARLVGPLVVLPVVMTLGAIGWLVLGAGMAAACAASALLAQSPQVDRAGTSMDDSRSNLRAAGQEA